MKKYIASILTVATLFSCGKKSETNAIKMADTDLSKFYKADLKPFYHGVASGDPLSDAVIIWTRVTPEDSVDHIKVVWEMAQDSSFTEIIASGDTITTPEVDYTVKVDVEKLKPATHYFYRFKALNGVSSTGRTLTTPVDNIDSLKFAVVSCSNFEWGYFNTYGRIADRQDIDAVIHLGDYIYEYAPGGYGDTTLGRIHIPDHELIKLQDYRERYAEYRLDQDLMRAHQMHPFISVWDDHEVANDAYVGGAQNHQPEEGDYTIRRNGAKQAYYEWLPVRAAANTPLYRTFHFGDLVEVIMLDERMAGRTAPVDTVDAPGFADSTRTMLGKKQFAWFTNELKESKATWKLIGNQVIFSYLNYDWPDFKINMDSWDGYPVEQHKLADSLGMNEIKNVVFVTGDTHSAWAFEANIDPFNRYNDEYSSKPVAIELGVTSINSSNSDERHPLDTVLHHQKIVMEKSVNPHIKYTNLHDHGYLLLTLFQDHGRADYYFVETVKKPTDKEFLEQTVLFNKDDYKLKL